MTTQHGIIAQSWQLSYDLRYMVFPLELMEMNRPISIFDLIFLKEAWTQFSFSPKDLVCRSMASPRLDSADWSPAITMPSRIAHYWFRVIDIDVYASWREVPFEIVQGAGLSGELVKENVKEEFRPKTALGRQVIGNLLMTLPPAAQVARNWLSLYPRFSMGDEYPLLALSIFKSHTKA